MITSVLRDDHRRQLVKGSGISEEVIAERCYCSVSKADLAALSFAPAQQREGLLIPVWTTDGRQPSLFVLRPDKPRIKDGKELKYELPKGAGLRLDCPPRCQPKLSNPSVDLWITEGQKKADALATHGLCAIAVLGVYGYKGKNKFGATTVLVDFDYAVWEDRRINICYDSDVSTKPEVKKALDRLTEILQRKGAHVNIVYLPPLTGDKKCGVDDFLLDHSVAELEDLIKYESTERRNMAQPAADSRSPKDSRPRIAASENDLPVITGQSWDAITSMNERQPRLFKYAGLPVRIEHAALDVPVLSDLTLDRLRYELANAAVFYETVAKTGLEYMVKPPADVVRNMLASPDIPLPMLSRIVETPVFAEDGRLQTTPGYHAASHTYYCPPNGFTLPDVPLKPTCEDVAHAKHLILDNLLCDFSFVGEADRSHAVAAFLLHYVRDMINGPTPGHLIEAPTPGSGKGLLLDVITLPFSSRGIGLVAEAQSDDEWRKRLTAQFREGHAVIAIDNISRPLKSGSLCSGLTAPIWTDRVLGRSQMITIPIRCLWFATGNNVELGTDEKRRFIRIRLDPCIARPWLRHNGEFKHPRLHSWALQNRSQLVWAALTIIRAWIAVGKPEFKGELLGTYEQWSAVMGGLLDTARIPGFLTNLDEFYDNTDTEGDVWYQLVQLWWHKHGRNQVTSKDLFPLALEVPGLDLGDGETRSLQTSLGIKLSSKRDQVIGDFKVIYAGQRQGAKKWQLKPRRDLFDVKSGEPVNLGEPFSFSENIENIENIHGGTTENCSEAKKVHQGSQVHTPESKVYHFNNRIERISLDDLDYEADIDAIAASMN